MARIVLGSYLVRYPLGGMVSYVLQYIVGLHKLGHEVYFVEKSGYPDSCYDPVRNQMTSDCSYGVRTIHDVLKRFGLEERFCYVDEDGRYHGVGRGPIEEVFRSADLFIEMGTNEAWLTEAAWSQRRILVDGDPGFSQIWMANRLAAGEQIPQYDAYFTVGSRVGAGSTAPTAGERWNHIFHPVLPELFPAEAPDPAAPFTTVMNWESYKTVEFEGRTYGHKNLEFEKFMALPGLTACPVEVAIAGSNVPRERLAASGWRIRDAHAVTISLDSFGGYIHASRGEFTVCKNGFVEMRTGWFGDRSSAYLASGRPVVAQDTGFGAALPCGRGLFAVAGASDAAAAIDEINANYACHSNAAREIAAEYLDAPKVMGGMLARIGL